jgi:hypothetical protein
MTVWEPSSCGVYSSVCGTPAIQLSDPLAQETGDAI